MKKGIAISSVSLIRTPEEGEIVLQTISELSSLNLPIIIADGGSKTEYVEKIKSYKNVQLYQTEGLMNQLKISQGEAAKVADTIFYLHTDKLTFVRENAKRLIELQLKNPKRMLIPVRDNESLNSYPPYQREAEQFLNFFVSDFIGQKNDYYAGPKLYPSSLVSYLDQLKEEINWGIEAYYYAIAKRLEMPFYFETVVSPSPQDIDDVDKTKDYRLKIVEWQIKGLLLGKQVNL